MISSANTAKLKRKAAEFEQKKQFEKALTLYIQVLEEAGRDLDDADLQLFNRVGDLLTRQGNLSEALAYYEKAVDVYAERGFLNNAIALCNKILRQSPGRSTVYYKLGKISASKGFKSDAKKNFLEYADRMQKSGQVDEAFRALKEFADLCPDQDDIRLMLAEWLTKENRKNEAVEQLETLYTKLEAEGRDAEARATIDRIKAIDPDAVLKSSGNFPAQKSSGLVFLDLDEMESPSARRREVQDAKSRTPATPGAPVLGAGVAALEGLTLTFMPNESDEIAVARQAEPIAGLETAAIEAGIDTGAARVSDERVEGMELVAGLDEPVAALDSLLVEPPQWLTPDDPLAAVEGLETMRTTLSGAHPAMSPLLDDPPLTGTEFATLALEAEELELLSPAHDLALPSDLPLLVDLDVSIQQIIDRPIDSITTAELSTADGTPIDLAALPPLDALVGGPSMTPVTSDLPLVAGFDRAEASSAATSANPSQLTDAALDAAMSQVAWSDLSAFGANALGDDETSQPGSMEEAGLDAGDGVADALPQQTPETQDTSRPNPRRDTAELLAIDETGRITEEILIVPETDLRRDGAAGDFEAPEDSEDYSLDGGETPDSWVHAALSAKDDFTFDRLLTPLDVPVIDAEPSWDTSGGAKEPSEAEHLTDDERGLEPAPHSALRGDPSAATDGTDDPANEGQVLDLARFEALLAAGAAFGSDPQAFAEEPPPVVRVDDREDSGVLADGMDASTVGSESERPAPGETEFDLLDELTAPFMRELRAPATDDTDDSRDELTSSGTNVGSARSQDSSDSQEPNGNEDLLPGLELDELLAQAAAGAGPRIPMLDVSTLHDANRRAAANDPVRSADELSFDDAQIEAAFREQSAELPLLDVDDLVAPSHDAGPTSFDATALPDDFLSEPPSFGDGADDPSAFLPQPLFPEGTLAPEEWPDDAIPEVLIDGEWHDEHVGELLTGDVGAVASGSDRLDDPKIDSPSERTNSPQRFEDLTAAMMWPPTASDASDAHIHPVPTPSAADAFTVRGNAPRPNLSFGGAETQLRRRLEIEPENASLRRSFGEVLLEHGERERGLQELDEAMRAFERVGDLEGARGVADVVLRVAPLSVRHHQKRVEYAVRSNDRPRLIEAYVELADALFQSGEAEKAGVVYARVVELSPGNARARFALGLVGGDAADVRGETRAGEAAAGLEATTISQLFDPPTRPSAPFPRVLPLPVPAEVATSISAEIPSHDVTLGEYGEAVAAAPLEPLAPQSALLGEVGDPDPSEAADGPVPAAEARMETEDGFPVSTLPVPAPASDELVATRLDLDLVDEAATAESHERQSQTVGDSMAGPDSATTEITSGVTLEVFPSSAEQVPLVDDLVPKPLDGVVALDPVVDGDVERVVESSVATRSEDAVRLPGTTDTEVQEQPSIATAESEGVAVSPSDSGVAESADQAPDAQPALDEEIEAAFATPSILEAIPSEPAATEVPDSFDALDYATLVGADAAALAPNPVVQTPAIGAGGGDDDEYIDLGEWLRDETPARSTRMVTTDVAPSGDEQADFDDMLRRFKQGVAENVEEEDYESHYDLGVAFKEMGLMDEAIAEFQKSLRGDTHRVRSYEALGQCFVEKGQLQVAIALLKRAVETTRADDQLLVGVLYLLAYASEGLERHGEALSYYQRVFAVDIEFRDVVQRVAAMERFIQ